MGTLKALGAMTRSMEKETHRSLKKRRVSHSGRCHLIYAGVPTYLIGPSDWMAACMQISVGKYMIVIERELHPQSPVAGGACVR